MFFPGAIFNWNQHEDPFDAAKVRLREKAGVSFIGQPVRRFLRMQKTVDVRAFRGYLTDYCLDFVVSGPVRGHPWANRSLGYLSAGFYDIEELDRSKIGYGHAALLDEYINDLVTRTIGFRLLRNNPSVQKELIPPSNLSIGDQQNYTAECGRIPIATATWIACQYKNPYSVLFIELQGAEEETFVLPGGIFDYLRHLDLFATGPEELMEEAGLRPVGRQDHPYPFALDLRRDTDVRTWCSQPTAHCCDLILMSAVRGIISPQDTHEVANARFIDVRELDPSQIGRGHDRIVDEWITAQMGGGPLEFRFIH